jgi:hypothetical protein
MRQACVFLKQKKVMALIILNIISSIILFTQKNGCFVNIEHMMIMDLLA